MESNLLLAVTALNSCFCRGVLIRRTTPLKEPRPTPNHMVFPRFLGEDTYIWRRLGDPDLGHCLGRIVLLRLVGIGW